MEKASPTELGAEIDPKYRVDSDLYHDSDGCVLSHRGRSICHVSAKPGSLSAATDRGTHPNLSAATEAGAIPLQLIFLHDGDVLIIFCRAVQTPFLVGSAVGTNLDQGHYTSTAAILLFFHLRYGYLESYRWMQPRFPQRGAEIRSKSGGSVRPSPSWTNGDIGREITHTPGLHAVTTKQPKAHWA